MQKTITISGKPVPFKVTGGFLIRYKEMTGRDPLSDLTSIEGIDKKINEHSEKAFEALKTMYRLFWVMAKTADPDVADSMGDWLDSFESFPLADVMGEVLPMLTSAFSSIVPDQSNSKKKTIKK